MTASWSRAAARPEQWGFTLTETLLALALSSLVGLAVTMMLTMAGTATKARFSTQESGIERQVTALRISSMLRGSAMVLNTAPDQIVLWRGDVNDDGAPNLAELRLIEFRGQDEQVWMYEAPAGSMGSPSASHDLSDDFLAIAGAAAGSPELPGQQLLDGVAGWSVALDNSDVHAAQTLACAGEAAIRERRRDDDGNRLPAGRSSMSVRPRQSLFGRKQPGGLLGEGLRRRGLERPRGAAMLLTLLATTIAFVVGLTYLATSGVALSTASVMNNHAQSRQIAESGLGIVVSYIERIPGWRSRPSGVWMEEFPLLGGTVTVDADYAPEASSSQLTPDDASFEEEIAQLSTPVLNPPMSGTVGGWHAERTAVLPTGPTVPGIGTQVSANASEGSNAAFISFGASVTGSGTFSQTLPTGLMPRTRYQLAVDVTVSTGLPSLTHGFRVLAGSTVVASSEQAWTLTLPTTPGQLPQPPSIPTDPEQIQSLLTSVGAGPGLPTAYSLSFVTPDDPPSGPISIELFAEATGLLSSVWFDNARFTAQNNDPVTFTVTGRKGEASHVVAAQVVKNAAGSGRILEWNEP